MPPERWRALGEDVVDHLSMDVSQAEIAATASVGQSFVIET